jgi:transposase-like protein
VCDRLQAPAAKVAELLEQAEDDLLAFLSFPVEHRSKLRSTNPLERVNREIARRSDVVGIYPNDDSLIRLAGCLLIEQCDEWLVQKRYLSQESLAALYTNERCALADTGQPALQRSAGRRRQEARPMITT